MSKQLQGMFVLTDKPIVGLNTNELVDHKLNVELFSPLTEGQYLQLKEDIKIRGIQDPLHVRKIDDDIFQVICGHQRRKIAIELKLRAVPCIVRTDLKEEWQVEEQLIRDNLNRRQLNDFSIASISEYLLKIEKIKAKQRQKTSTGGKEPQLVEKLPQADKGKSRDKVAKQFNISGKQLDKIKYVYENATPEVKEEWKEEKISTHRAFLEITKKDKGMSDHSRKTLFSSDHDDWATPKEEYDKLNKEFKFDFDPCPFKSTFDGLKIDWKKRNFINPPYSNVAEFLKKGKDELKKGNAELLVYLVPVRTDTKWFHTYVNKDYEKDECEIRFIKGRLKFSNGKEKKNSAPFPSMEVIFRRSK